MVRVVFNEAELHHLSRSLASPVARDLERRGVRVQNRARQLAPSRKRPRRPNETGPTLKQSIRTSGVGVDTLGLYIDIGSDLKHSVFMENGTPAHQILPRHPKEALWWGDEMTTPRLVADWRREYSGRPLFVESVNHPGTRPQPYLKPALEAAR